MNGRHAAAAAVALAVLAGSLAPGSTAGGLPAGADKLLHALGYGALAATVASARGERAPRALAGVVLAVTALGVGIELAQPLVGRAASTLDVLANLVGGVAGALAWSWRRANRASRTR